MAGIAQNLKNRQIAHDIYKQRLSENVGKLGQDIQAMESELARLDQLRQDQTKDARERQRAHEDFARISSTRKRMERERANTEKRLQHADILAAGAAAKSAGKAVAGGVSAAARPVGLVGRGLAKLGSGAVFMANSSSMMTLFTVLAAVVHWLEMLVFSFNRGPAMNPFVILAYGLLVLVGTFAYGGFDLRRFFILTGIAALYVWFFPFILQTFNAPDAVQAALFWIPLWQFLIYRTSDPDSFSYKFSGLYVKIIIFVFVVVTLFYLASVAKGSQFHSGFEWKTAFDYVWQPVKKAFSFAWDALSRFPKFLVGWFDKTWNEAYYIGQVENNKGAPLGVYLDEFKPLEETVYEGTVVDLLAKLRAASFVGNVTINMSCSARSADGRPGIVKGRTEPNYTFVEGRSVETVFCRFFENQLSAQSYKVSFEAGFNFETWAYTEYTFVDSDLRRSYFSRGLDINSELAIPESAQATYTNGPIMIGTIDSPLPQAVDKNTAEWTMPFAVTVENQWDGGEVKKVNEYVIYVPKELEFVPGSCNAEMLDVLEQDNIEGLSAKRFSLSSNRLNQDFKFTTLTCRLRIAGTGTASDDDSRASLLGQTVKAVRTFAIKVKYDYSIRSEVDLEVQEYVVIRGWSTEGDLPDASEPEVTDGHPPFSAEHDLPAPIGAPKYAPSGADGSIITTVYYTPDSSEFGQWSAGGEQLKLEESARSGNAWCRSNPSYCCIRPNLRGFYEDVKCQGSGNHEGQVYIAKNIKPTEAESIPLSGAYKNGITAKGTDPEPTRTIAVNSLKTSGNCHIPYYSRVYLKFPQSNNPWTGWYVAEDTGSALKDKCKIDIYAGLGKDAAASAERWVGNKRPEVWVLSQDEFERTIKQPIVDAATEPSTGGTG